MKKRYLLLLLALILAATPALAARQTISPVAPSSSPADLRGKLNVELDKANDNDVELYIDVATKADYAEVLQRWHAFPAGHTFAIDDLVMYGGKIYKAVTEHVKGDNPVAGPTNWQEFFVAGQGSNLAATAGASTVVVTNDNGTGITIPAATGSTAGVMTAADATKLSGVAAGATANSSDATLLARANHTGTQAASTISDFATAVTGNATISAALSKLAGIQSGAQVNVKPDWNATPGTAAEILNQPDVVATDQDFTVTAKATFQDIDLPKFDIAESNVQANDDGCTAGVYGYYFTSTKMRQCINGTASDVGSGTGSMTYPGAGIANSTGSAWGTSYSLDTDLGTVSSNDDSVPSAKAVKAAIDAVSVASGVDHRTSDPDDPATGYTWIRTDTGNEALKSATATGILSVDLTYTADDFTPAAFSFDAVVDAELGATVVSGPVEIDGLGTGRKTPISIANGAGSTGCAYGVSYDFNEVTPTWSSYTSTAGKLDVNNTNLAVRVQQTASSSASTETTCDLTVGSMTRSTSVTTEDTGITYLREEGFEGTGKPASWDTNGTGTVDWDYTDTVLVDSQSLQITGPAASGMIAQISRSQLNTDGFASGTTNLFAQFRYRPTTWPSQNSSFFTINGTQGLVEINNAGRLRANVTGGTAEAVDSVFALDTTIYVRVRITLDGTLYVWTSANGTDWTERISITNGTTGQTWNNNNLVLLQAGFSGVALFDEVKVWQE
jgi:hypothetical protein